MISLDSSTADRTGVAVAAWMESTGVEAWWFVKQT